MTTVRRGIQTRESARRPRVLLVLNRYFPMVGGAERQCRLLCDQLQGRVTWAGLLTHRYDATLQRCLEISGVPVVRLGRPAETGRAPISFYISLLSQLVRHGRDSDLIHCHTAGFTGLWVALLGRVLSRPVLLKLTVEGELRKQFLPRTTSTSLASRLKNRSRAAIARMALHGEGTHVVALTPAGAEEARALGVRNVVVIPNGVDAERYRRGQQVDRSGPRIFGYAGRLTAEKGTALLAEAFEELLERQVDVELHIAGSDERQLASSLPALQRLAARHPSRVRLLGALDSTIAFLHGIDVYVSASTYEGLPNAVLEALAAGLPCVLSDIDAHREMARLNPHAHIRLFQSGDVTACVGAIRQAATEPLVASCLNPTLEMRSVANRYLALYEDMILAKKRVK